MYQGNWEMSYLLTSNHDLNSTDHSIVIPVYNDYWIKSEREKGLDRGWITTLGKVLEKDVALNARTIWEPFAGFVY